jgi:crotonobetainyl-CoA:carnitine CoA-transferase CaiB-like acyl-CoA transferase
METSPPLLNNIVILDLTRVLAGPYCTMTLGDLGAEVIKVEMPGKGDDTRSWGPPFTDSGESAYFLSANRNKKSVTLNLKTDEGIRLLKQLIQKADVLIDNFRTGTLEKWGLSYDELQKIRPGIIYATITGYGYTGPYKDKPGYDFMVQALSGLMSVTGSADGEPTRVGIAVADLATGIFTSNAILAALFARERTGKGSRIDLALLDTQVALMSYVASNYLVSEKLPIRLGNGHPNIVPYQSFKAKDQYFAFAAGNDNQWGKFCRAVNKPDWITDEISATNQVRVENREVVIKNLTALFLTKNANQWIKICEEIGVPAAPINNIKQTFADPQVIDREMKVEVNHETTGKVPMVGSPMKIPTSPVKINTAPPTLGQHTDTVLAELLNLTEKEIQSLREENII